MPYVYTDNNAEKQNYLPGTILKINSTRFPGVGHYGGVDWSLDETGRPMIWHAQKHDVFRRTNFADFTSSEIPEVVRTPQCYEQQVVAIERFRLLEGTPWTLFQTNCEQQIRWAVEGEAHSTQLNAGLLIASLGAALLWTTPKKINRNKTRRRSRRM
jgi:hypothetical protein